MLNPRTISDAIATALQTIPGLVTAMGGDSSRITAFHYEYGNDNRLELAINSMSPPSIMVVFDGTLAGNFDSATIWKHKFCIYIRMDNAATGSVGYEDIWFSIVNGKVFGGIHNIREINLVVGADIMDTPSFIFALDEDRMEMATVNVVVPEWGDS